MRTQRLRRHFCAVNLAMVGVCAALAGLVVSGLLQRRLAAGVRGVETAPARSREKSTPGVGPASLRPDPHAVAKRDIFCSDCASRGSPGVPPLRNPFHGNLLCTLVPAGPGGGLALIRTHDPERLIMAAPGKRIGDAVVRAIMPRRVELARRGRTEFLELLEGTGPPMPPQTAGRYGQDIRRIGPDRYEISGRLFDRFLARGAILAKGVHARPVFRGAAMIGYRVQRVSPQSPLHDLGIRAADTIHAVNNIEVSDWDRMLELAAKMRGASHLSISLTRGRRRMSLDYTVRR